MTEASLHRGPLTFPGRNVDIPQRKKNTLERRLLKCNKLQAIEAQGLLKVFWNEVQYKLGASIDVLKLHLNSLLPMTSFQRPQDPARQL